MIQINKEKQISNDITKLIIKTPKEALVIQELQPKELNQTKQLIQPVEETKNNNVLFEIY
jgi:hypothetical protein